MNNKLRFNTNGDGLSHSNGNGRLNLDGGRKSGKPKLKTVKAKDTPNQQAYLDAIERADIIFCLGPAGTGKTHLAAGMASKLYKEERVEKIIGIRPAIEAGRSLGFVPGDLDDKLHPYLKPLLTELCKFIGAEELKKRRSGEFPVVELGALGYLRGTNFEDSIVVMDEAQNATFAEMIMFLTRLSYGSKLIINGDTTRWKSGPMQGTLRQCDLHPSEQGALEHYANLYADFPEVAVVHMTNEDIVRHPLVRRMLERDAQ